MIVDIAVDRSKPLNPDGPEKWSAWVDGVPLVTRVRDPEHAACRALLAAGTTGRVAFRHLKTGTIGLSMDIEWGAGRSAYGSSLGGWQVGAWKPRLPSAGGPLAHVKGSAGTDLPA